MSSPSRPARELTVTEHIPLLESLSVLADPTRTRLLLQLEGRELTVGELCAVVQAPQSTVSRHLKILGNDGWLASRKEGTRRYYRLEPKGLDPAAARLWKLIRRQAASTPTAAQDARRLAGVLARRGRRSRAFFSSAAREWDGLRAELFGVGFELHALLGLLDAEWVVGDLGCGTGRVAELLAPVVRRVIAVDGSTPMLEAARGRLAAFANVEVRKGELESLPVEDGELDAAALLLVLHHVAAPEAVLRESWRGLRPGGRLLLVDMAPHDREDYRRRMGHVWLGFAPSQIVEWLEAAGFEAARVRPLPPPPSARGPELFAVTARRAAAGVEPAVRRSA